MFLLPFTTLQIEQFRSVAGVLVFLIASFFLWALVMRWARRVRGQVEALAALARAPLPVSSENGEPVDEHEAALRLSELDAARRRLTALRLVTNAARYVLGASVLIAVLKALNAPLDGLLVPAGFLGAALGLGAQNLIRDFVSGLFIVFEGQFAVGDTVIINDKTGVVDEIGLRVTRIRDESGTLFYFPNGAVTSVAKFPRRETELVLSIPLITGTDIAAAAALAQSTIADFGASFDALKGSIRRADTLTDPETGSGTTTERAENEPTPKQDAQNTEKSPAEEAPTLIFAVPLRPSRVALAREKLPPRLLTALDHAGYKLRPGAEVGSFIAPPK